MKHYYYLYTKTAGLQCLHEVGLQGGPKMAVFLYALTSSNTKRFSKLFHCQNQEKICNTTITKDSTTPQVCRYTTFHKVV